MNLFFEAYGNLNAGRVLSQQGNAYHVELISGKRNKIKFKDVILQFLIPTPTQFMQNAHKIAHEIDLHFLWEVAGESEFFFQELGNEYFGHIPLPYEAAGLLLVLHSSPMYFYKKGKGFYKAASSFALQAALASVHKKQQQIFIQTQYMEQLISGNLPQAFQSQITQLLFRPEKNSIEFKALDNVCKKLQTTPSRFLIKVGGLKSAKDLHYAKFLFNCFPQGSSFPSVTIPSLNLNLPLAGVKAFSIDDVTTTEIDDALSVMLLTDNKVCIGVHIAAPSLGIKRNDALDVIARRRMSTVYIPGEKITMLPESLIKMFTLNAGKYCPALSLYTTLNKKDWSVLSIESKTEMVLIAANLRYNDLDMVVTEESLMTNDASYPYKEDITLLWKWAEALKQKRMLKRESVGLKGTQINQVSFNFYINNNKVTIIRRKRDAPLNKIVAELMIFANSTWGKLMYDYGVPGVYRIQSGKNLSSKLSVRMLTAPAPHHSLGVNQYAWSTSPLRRYIDLVNQWQILACLEHGLAAAQIAPFKFTDTTLCKIVSSFNSIFSSYNIFQSDMERYWCLRWLQQENIKEVDAIILKNEMARLIDIPLIIRLPGMPIMPRGAQVRLSLLRFDEIDLTIEARLLKIVPLNNVNRALFVD